MKRLIHALMAILALSFAPAIVHAQSITAVTVATCGTPANTPVVGNAYFLTQDLTLTLCTKGGAGGAPATPPPRLLLRSRWRQQTRRDFDFQFRSVVCSRQARDDNRSRPASAFWVRLPA